MYSHINQVCVWSLIQILEWNKIVQKQSVLAVALRQDQRTRMSGTVSDKHCPLVCPLSCPVLPLKGRGVCLEVCISVDPPVRPTTQPQTTAARCLTMTCSVWSSPDFAFLAPRAHQKKTERRWTLRMDPRMSWINASSHNVLIHRPPPVTQTLPAPY